ncbi:hypothetical protein EBZ38_04885 [bacterium]|nr:hypothetical protein [bacterium]NDD83605.1 hypothetical protein [bacterium]
MAGVLALVVLCIPTSSVYAQKSAGSGLSISPTRNELTIKPGSAGTISITLKNVTRFSLTAKALINDFEADTINQTGEPRLITDTTKRSAASVKEFIPDLKDVELAPDQEKEVSIPVQLPAKAAPGAYYGVIRYQAVPKASDEQGSSQVALTASVGSLVLIEVPGNITEKIQIENIKVFIGEKAGTLFTKKPTQVGIQIKNLGNSFSKPFGQVQVFDIRGKQVYAYELNNTTPRANILPSSSRIFKDELKGVNAPGRYKVTANISFGRGGEILNYTSTFWYIPFWLLIIAAAVILLLIGSAFYLFRRYNSQAVSRRK